MISKSVLIRDGQLDSLLRFLSDHYGYPAYEDELVIYISGGECKISIRRSGIVCRWIAADRELPEPYGRMKHRLTLDVRNVKDTLLFFAQHYAPEGVINRAPMFSYYLPACGGVWVNVRPDSLVGALVNFLLPQSFQTPVDHTARAKKVCAENIRFFRKFRRGLKPFLVPAQLRSRMAAIRKPAEPYLLHANSNAPVLAPSIIDFCRWNGLMHPFRWDSTYRKLLQERDNDYTKYEAVFRQATCVDLLSATGRPAPSTKNAPRASIIIPCWNVEQTINRTLGSIASQRLADGYADEHLEVILVDDGSDRPVADFVRASDFKFRISVIRLGLNHGVSHAREIGLAHASGDVILFLDGDIILSRDYLADHIVRNSVIRDAVFVSFKENVESSDARISPAAVGAGAEVPDYSGDLRVYKKVRRGAIGTYKVPEETVVRILEETAHFKRFPLGNYGPYDLACMVVGHNFSCNRQALLRAAPFERRFKGYGMEDQYFGLRMLSDGSYIIPVLSSGVFHINHPPRAGSKRKQDAEKRRNARLINDFLDSPVS